MLKYYVLASGSKGNATVIDIDGRLILIDMGLTRKAFRAKMAECGLDFEAIDIVLVTHQHSDHTHGLKFVDNKKIYSHQFINIPDDQHMLAFQTYDFDFCQITPFELSHDAHCFGYIIDHNDERLVYMTDTGYIKDEYLSYLYGAHYYIIESNHDPEMLMKTNRPYNLKQRIINDRGHLSNEDCANALTYLISEDTREVVLAHLSQEANTPRLCRDTILKVFKQRDFKCDHVTFKIASQTEIVQGN